MNQPSTQLAVAIENEMPRSLRCVGAKVKSTKDLSVGEISLFIERDIHVFLKKLSILDPEYSVSLVKHDGIEQVRVDITVQHAQAVFAVTQRIENILWSYNEQILAQRNGRLFALPPKFQFKINITARESHMESIES